MRDVHELLEGREGPRLDFKRDLSSMAKVVRTLAAMGNTAGGHVVVGVDDHRTVPGLTDPLKDEEALSRAIADSIEPLLPVEISVQHVGAVNVLVAEVLRWKGPFGIRTEGMRREDVPEYAPVTVRELLLNAIAHTDYALTGSQILVAIFDDRLEIQNPGSFVYGSTVETIKQGISRVRNRAIVRILRELHLMEILGSGYERISTTFDDGYPEPDWRELGVVVRVTTPTHPFFVESDDGDREGDEGDREGDGSAEGDHLVDGRSMSAEQRAAWVLAKIDAGRPVTNQYLARTLGVSLATVERLTSHMQQDGTIRWSGTRRSGRFQRT